MGTCIDSVQPFFDSVVPTCSLQPAKQPPVQSQCRENAAVMDDVQVWPFTCYDSQNFLREGCMMDNNKKKFIQVKDSVVKKVLTIF